MLNNEINDVKDYLNNVLKKEEQLLNEKTKTFYYKYKIPLIPIFFPIFYKEDFFLILKYLNYGIYYNDIEETFGICKIVNNKCFKYADFSDNLNATINKFQELLTNNNLETLWDKT